MALTYQQRLGGEDAAWLHMEDATNPMVVTGVLDLEAPLPEASLARVLDDLVAIPRFRSRVVEPTGGHLGAPHWELVRDFRLEDHVERVRLEDAGDGALRDFVARTAGGLLDRERPLWKIYVVERPAAGTSIVFRVHHALADGFGLLGVLLALCSDGAGRQRAVTPSKSPVPTDGALGLVLSAGRLIALPPDPRTPLKGKLGTDKRVAWSRPIPLDEVKEIAHRANATVNDVLVALVSGALRRYLGRRGASVEAVEVRAMVPVNLRAPNEATTLGNNFGLVVLALPIGIVDPIARIGAVSDRMRRLKRSQEAVVAHVLLRAMGVAPRPVEDLGVAFFAKKASLVLTNVPGPRQRVSLGGVPVTRISFWVPQSGRMGLGISIFSYAGEVTVGFLADAGLVSDPEVLAEDLGEELRSLEAELSAGVS